MFKILKYILEVFTVGFAVFITIETTVERVMIKNEIAEIKMDRDRYKVLLEEVSENYRQCKITPRSMVKE